MPNHGRLSPRGRGAGFNTPNRFEKLHLEPDEECSGESAAPTEFFEDRTRSILAENDSPDLGFTYSINPYRGCEHGCIYCYARPTHEYLGFSAGLDFESRIMVKTDAPQLLAEAFRKKSWVPQPVALSGNTDPYQPVERRLGLTRRCLEVFLEYRNPVQIITKGSGITRDLDLLRELSRLNLVHVQVSITTLDPELARRMEPRASSPALRLENLQVLAENGVSVGVNAAPLIPGLTDEELPAILMESAARGARTATYIMVRLPGAVEPLFVEWMRREFPDRADKVLNRIADIRGGRLNDPRFFSRMRGQGRWAESIRDLFRLSCKRHGLNREPPDLSTAHFVRRTDPQLHMFPEG